MGDELVVKLGIVHFLASFLFGTQNETRVDNKFFGMVDCELSLLKKFAFGKLLWQRTRCYMRSAIKKRNALYMKIPRKAYGSLDNWSYKCFGFPLAFLIWIYETLPSYSSFLCRRIGSSFPRILNWHSKDSVSYHEVLEKVFIDEKVVFFLSLFCVVFLYLLYL